MKNHLRSSNTYVNGNFQVKYHTSAGLHYEDDVRWLQVESTKKGIVKKVEQNQNQFECLPYALLLKDEWNDLDSESKTDIIEVYDTGNPYESPMNSVCSLRLLQLLHFFGLTNIGIAANVVIVTASKSVINDKVDDFSVTQDSNIGGIAADLNQQLNRHLDFFKEKA